MQAKYLAVTDAFGNRRHEVGVGDGVEVFGEIGIDDLGVAGVHGIRYVIDCVVG